MKRRSGLGIAIGGLAAITLAGSTLAFTGPTNGGFEDVNVTYVDGGSGFQQLNAVDTSIDGWSVDAGSVDWIGTYWPAPEGAMSIDMSGVNAGTLSQTFATTIGNTYTVSFVLSGNPAGDPAIKTLDVSATGGTVSNYTHNVTDTDLTSMVWTPETYTFLATSASSMLSFTSTTDGAFGPAIDNVVVSESVPVKDDCKQGGWQTMIDNAGNSFKNQGDCVSYFATKGKNLGAVPPVVVAADANATTDAASATAGDKHSSKGADKAAAKSAAHDAKTKTKTKSHGSHHSK